MISMLSPVTLFLKIFQKRKSKLHSYRVDSFAGKIVKYGKASMLCRGKNSQKIYGKGVAIL